ncbi:hypothetical protein [Thalassospira profundimaris]|uniref:Uncharacterized protein n=1 Tax=Thalassospira profundimaris TaxID=502049 RepID=A0A367WPQ1_9PROT|nr:hypothetical protein [Thalassospira profundimaris]RCK43179.1 hypothetical protein TH30_19345 [Thalassospira profundimaris]
MYSWPFEGKEEIARQLEASETAREAARAILRSELLTSLVWDPACGRGICAEAAKEAGYQVYASDVYNWGYGDNRGLDFLKRKHPPKIFAGREFSVFSNVPFSMACEFVRQSFALGARKLVLFQRQAWLEGGDRKDFWREFPYQRQYLCRKRVSCYWFHFSPQEREDKNSGTTAYSWYVFERGQNSTFQSDWIDFIESDYRPMQGIAHASFDIRVSEEKAFRKSIRKYLPELASGKEPALTGLQNVAAE